MFSFIVAKREVPKAAFLISIMFTLFRKTNEIHAPPKKSEKASLEDVLSRPDVSKLLKRIKDLLIDDAADSLALNMSARLLGHLWFLPASEGHHHAKEFGLFLHCLETGMGALERFDEIQWQEHRENNDIDSFETRRQKPRKQYAAFCGGLLHDLGKASVMCSVVVGSEAWDACSEESLYHFAKRSGATYADIQYNIELENKYWIYEKITPFFAARLFNSDDYRYIGPNDLGEILSAIGGNTGKGNKFKAIITDSDMSSTSDNLKADPVVAAKTNDIIGEFMDALKELFRSGRIPVNGVGAAAWVFEHHTAVTFPKLKDAIIILQSQGKKPPDLNKLLSKLSERGLVDKEEGSWKCTYNMDIKTMGRPQTYKVIKIKNSVLWEQGKRPDICSMDVEFNIAS